MHLRITRAARRDISRTLAESRDRFGEAGRARYRELITQALKDLETGPDVLGSTALPEIGRNYRAYHLRFARMRTPNAAVRRPRHMLVYRSDSNGIVVQRLLHERQVVARHVNGSQDVDRD